MNNHADTVPAAPARDLLPPEGLTWGVKRSFVRYLTSLPDGAVAAVEGASVLESGFFNFPPDGGSFDPAAGTGILRFRGDVRLEGHFGMMFVQIANPWIELGSGGGFLTVALGEPGEAAERIPLISFAAAVPQTIGGSLVWQGLETRLTREGSDVFNQQYGTGQEMDPLSIRLPAPDAE
ncbi:HtaA domain-containing protein [Arthrobacter sp. I2-34]|uniref:HtaA domain-containing protein n=1 Tax=Arthrobacter hankyongi TaxID=2904801 RepID=A0ABS9L2C0_9MICC|nr:HtaA domain-containing protein [Arthrobacter hankyongi]MCG2620785.1 HtaA domain-containing protein [Arthrobacter hankyongi]